MTNEHHGRPVFYGAMITEGIVALIWAAAATIFFHDNGMADVTISGMLQTNQPYVAGNMGGVDTIMVTYMNYTQLMYNVGETGLDLNYMGTMDMHFEAQ